MKIRHFENSRSSAGDVAQIANLRYRRIVFGGSSQWVESFAQPAAGGLQIRDTAECNSALPM